VGKYESATHLTRAVPEFVANGAVAGGMIAKACAHQRLAAVVYRRVGVTVAAAGQAGREAVDDLVLAGTPAMVRSDPTFDPDASWLGSLPHARILGLAD